MKVFITGAAGYIGGMLVDRMISMDRVERIVALDVKPPPASLASRSPKVEWVTSHLARDRWEDRLRRFAPDVVIHCAHLFRELYGDEGRRWLYLSNITSSQRVFDFALRHDVEKLIYFSSAAPYGAFASNSPNRWFTEDDALRESGYLYAQQKKQIEEMLRRMCDEIRPATRVTILRPAVVTGPLGRRLTARFGLLYAADKGLPFVPVTWPTSIRQYVHEDDVVGLTLRVIESPASPGFDSFNIAPPDFLTLEEVAKHLGKKPLRLPLWLGKLIYATFWHASRGKIPTSPGTMKAYSFPVVMDGSKSKELGYTYKFSGLETLCGEEGYYQNCGSELPLPSPEALHA